MKKHDKPWGGRFSEPTDREVEAFTSSLHCDRRLYRYDIEGSIAHARMLARQGIITPAEARKICAGLRAILAEIGAGEFVFSPDDEDIHMAVEKALIGRIGDAGGKLHTGRSRNDQIALDIRLYLREEIGQTLALVGALKAGFLALAKKELGAVLPGYTHLQKAQPVLLSHYLLAFWEMLDRDEGRLRDCLKRVNVMPLGSAALAGTGLPLDRRWVARLLGFKTLTANSMDAVSDRDFIAEFIFAASLVMMHLSRFCEDIVLWSTDEFGYVEIADAFTTGSSIMPQKKNPDVAELVRGKTGRVYGNLVALLTLLKGLPMTYNRDLQEDKEPLFDTVDTLQACLKILAAMIGRLSFNHERMEAGAGGGFSTATDVAEYLVMKGVPFREAHGIVGRIVAHCIKAKKPLTGLTLAEFRRFFRGFDKDVFGRLTVRQSVNVRKVVGGTAEQVVRERIAEIEGP
ncbi:MAG: argininosuccinate lyase [Proteobacteria bacterium]|nr:argininosuccinate lyase [Pseudomonadota bacterium]MBU2262776.1 argininosuccinate lyase [Pseudomonadota bacterium]